MSIFESKLINKVYLDDTINLSCTIINAESVQGHTEYVLRVQRGPLPENSWHVHRRYNDFLSLHQEFQAAGIILPLPPKKIIGNMDREFIAERQAGLEKYLDLVLKDPVLSSHLLVKKFLDPHNYNNYQEFGFTKVCIKLRGELDIKIIKQLPQLGWRLRKEHYLVQIHNDNKEEYIMTWIPFGPDKYLDDKQILLILKAFSCLQHVNITPLTKIGLCQDGGWVVRPLKKCGTILDLMYGVKAPHTTSVLRKYKNAENKNMLPVTQIIEIFSQILQTLAFLHYKGIPYGHLHLGNIVLERDIVKLLEIENGLFGLPSYYRDSFVKVRQMQSSHSTDVYCLGLVIYEMLFGKPFTDFHCKEISQCPPVLKPVLESILCPNSKTGIPTIADLLNLEIFRQSPPTPQPYLKLSSAAKQHLLTNAMKTMDRLKEDQIKYRQHLRTKKMYDRLNEDEGKMLVCYKKKQHVNKEKDTNEINGNVEVPKCSESISSKDSLKNSACSEEKCIPSNIIEDDGRSALLGAICNFNKNNLKKVNH